ncbi:MAG: hypothetical protein IJ646_04800, partial [Clostridia bacterium]|nr:hypothetical protein [Clostridia bacterium]
LAALAAWSAPGLGLYAWGAAAAVLAVDALLLAKKRPMPKLLYGLLAFMAAALIALGVFVRGYLVTDDGLTPREALVKELQVTNAWPAAIERYTGVEVLDMRGSTVTDFSPILSMRNLRALDARGNAAFGEAEYEAVAKALPGCDIQWSMDIAGRYYDSDIDAIDLSGTGMDAHEIAALQAEHPDVDFTYTVTVMGKDVSLDAEALDLQGARDVDADALLAALSLLPNVKAVDLRGAAVDLDTAEALTAARPDLAYDFTFAIPGGTMDSDAEVVTLPGGTYEDLQAAMAFMPYMPRLQYLDARAIVMNAAESQELQADARSAKVLYNFTVFGNEVNILTTQLDLDNVAMQGPEQAEAALRLLPNLERVSMVGCGLSQADMMALCDAHPQIRFIWVVEFGKYKLRTDATAFTTNLYADNKEHYTSETFAPLRYCTDLKMLDIGHCDLTDIGFIAGMKDLRVLILADNDITDLSPLADKENLEYVEIFLNKVVDFSPLANKPHLLDLNIYYNPIGDVTPLTTDTALERLWLGECGLSSGQINTLRQALPNCKINAKGSSSTGRGWREHKRYNVIKQMYKEGEYVPFS